MKLAFGTALVGAPTHEPTIRCCGSFLTRQMDAFTDWNIRLTKFSWQQAHGLSPVLPLVRHRGFQTH